MPTNLRFPGQYADAETGLSQNWNRDYDPTMGRYTQSDPIGLDGGINTYGYADQSPNDLIDPDGTGIKGSIIGGVAGGIIGGIGGSAIGPEGTVAGAIEGAELGSSAGSVAEDLINATNARHSSTNECPNPECIRLNQKIGALTSELKKRYSDLGEDKFHLPATGPMSIAGHQQQFRNKQANLRRLLNEANSKGCKGYNPDAWNWATRPTPASR